MVNKFDRPVQKDWSWQTAQLKAPTLDYEMLNSIAMEKQAEYDNIASLNALVPNALQNPDDLAKQQEYRALVEQGTKATTDAYMKSASAGAMSYRDFKNQVQKAWQPGGSADMLNKRYQGYYAAEKAIDEYYKDDTSPVNKTLAKQRLKEQAAQPTGWDPATGKYNVINTPELYKDPKINEGIDQMLKEIKENGTTSLLGDFNKDWYVQKIQTETREPERIKLAYQALASQPQYAAQIQRDADYKAMTINPAKHQAAYENTLNTNLANLTQTAEDAKKDKQSTIDWQNTLRQQGYNVKADGDFGVLTEKATKEFLDSQKQSVADGISKYDFKNQMINEVDKGYLGYALRGAYKKVEMTPIFNRAKEAQMDYSLKKEANSIALWSAQQQWAPKPGPNATVVSGVAGQLPVINDYYMEQKNLAKKTEADLNKAISNTNTFKGWDLKNVAEAYNVWDKVRGNTEEEKKANYKQLLTANSNGFQYTDEQVNSLYQEMNGGGPGMIKTSLKAYGDIQGEVHRLEEGQGQIADQYIKTSDGAEQLRILRQQSPPGLKNLSDAELVRKALTDPDLFEIKVASTPETREAGVRLNNVSMNAAKTFKSVSDRQIAKQQREGVHYDWGSLGTTEIYVNSKDELLKPTLDGISDAILTGTNLNFTTFGQAGIEYRDKEGKKVDEGSTRKVETMAVTTNEKRQPVLRVGVTITPPSGKPYLAFTDLDMTPGRPEVELVKQGLEKEYANSINAGRTAAAEGILDNINALSGNDNVKYASADIGLKDLNVNNTSPEPIYQEVLNANGTKSLVDVTTLGWLAKDFQMNDNINGFGYQLYGFNTRTGNVAANVFIDPEGKKIISKDLSGASTYNSTASAKQALLGKEILSRTPIEVTQQKVHGSGVTESRSSTTIESRKSTNE